MKRPSMLRQKSVVEDAADIAQANHDVYALESVVDELHDDFQTLHGCKCLIEDRARIQAAADRLTALLQKLPLPIATLEAAE
jgi:hypothetical protein